MSVDEAREEVNDEVKLYLAILPLAFFSLQRQAPNTVLLHTGPTKVTLGTLAPRLRWGKYIYWTSVDSVINGTSNNGDASSDG